MFPGLGKLKLVKLEHFDKKPTIEEVMMIDGFAETSAKVYVDNYDNFFNFIKNLPVTVDKKKESIPTSNDLLGKQFVFTGIRLPDIEEVIKSKGGKIGSSVSKNTTYLVMKIKGTGSSKEVKAIDLGVTILTVDELMNMI